jgi:hypothetical protein
MKNYIYYFIFSSILVFGQQNTNPNLVSTAGASLEGWGLTSLKMDFSIGEIIINTGFADDFIITQGFHQENIYMSTINEDASLDLTVFPNPTSSMLNIDLQNINFFPIQIDVFDVTGKQWRATDFVYDKTHTISLDGLAEGVYFLIVENKHCQNIYKIHKTK